MPAPRIDPARVRELHGSGLSSPQMAAALGCTPEAARYWCRKLGLVLAGPQRSPADLSAQEFGRLRPVRRVGSDRKGNALWVCHCDPELGGCGAETPPMPACRLVGGNTKSCGCLRGEHTRTPEFRAAQARRGRRAIRKTLASAGWRRLNRHVHPKRCRRCGRGFRGTARQRYCSVDCRPSARRRKARCFRVPRHPRRPSATGREQ